MAKAATPRPKAKAMTRKQPAKSAAVKACSAQPAAAVKLAKQKELRDNKAQKAVLARRLDRRDSEEKRNRCIETMLGAYDEIIISTRRRASDNKTIAEVVQEELRRLRPTGKYISTQFWSKLHSDFELSSPMFSDLPEITDDVDPDPALIEALSISQDQSRALRSADAFESYMRHCKPVDRTTLIVVLQQSREGPVITRTQSRSMLLAVMGHMGRHNLKDKYVDVWATASGGAFLGSCRPPCEVK